jgi:UMF1 family MFS transporter
MRLGSDCFPETMPQLSNSWLRKPVLGWLLYDVASSGYIQMIPALAFAIYYRQAVCGGTPDCDAKWAMLTSLSLVVAGILSPFLGALSDVSQLRHRLFVGTTLLCCIATASLFWVQPGDLVFGGMAFFWAQTGYILSMSLYDAYLPSLVSRARLGQLSTIGWGLGFLGGLACFLLTYHWVQGGLVDANLPTYRLTFLLVAVFYVVLALPALAWLPRQRGQRLTRGMVGQAYNQVFDTLKGGRRNPDLFQFLLGYYLISDGVVTIANFSAIFFVAQFGLTMEEILRLVLLFNGVTIPATIGIGFLQQRWSGMTLLRLILAIWVILLSLMVFSTHPLTPVIVVGLQGIVIGSTQSICRGLYAQMVPVSQAAELFGFNALVSKVSAVGGPLVFGFISSATGNQRLAMVSVLMFILAGGWVLFRVPVLSSASRRLKTDGSGT